MASSDESTEALLQRIEEELLNAGDPARRAALKEWRQDVLRQQAADAASPKAPIVPQQPAPPRPSTRKPAPAPIPEGEPAKRTVQSTVSAMAPPKKKVVVTELRPAAPLPDEPKPTRTSSVTIRPAKMSAADTAGEE
ncbi:MAG: hypothetical protein AAFV53_23600 [Myxococcota bacterium]